MVAKKKVAGGNLTRSQVVTVRLDPKLKFAAELAARKQRRTISSFIEWAVEQAIGHIEITAGDTNNSGDTIQDALVRVWDVEKADRVAKLAIYYPQLLSYEEEQIWKIIRECGHFWEGGSKPDTNNSYNLQKTLHFDRVRKQWEELKNIINGETSSEVLKSLPVDEPPYTEDDLPF